MNATHPCPKRGFYPWLAALMLAVPALLSGPAASAKTGGARQLVEQTIESLQAAVTAEQDTLKANPDKAIALVDRIVSPHIDIQRAGRWILGRYWRTASPGQRQAFIKAFRGMLLRTYATQIVNYADVQISYLPERTDANGTRAVVPTRVARAGAPLAEVDYRLYRKNGVWKVYDVVADGISIVSTFREAVGADIEHYGLDQVIARMNSRNAEKVAARSGSSP